jgi:allophanate hydrolase
MLAQDQSFDLGTLRAGYRAGRFTPADVVETVFERISTRNGRGIWIECLTRTHVRSFVDALAQRDPDDLPLFGVPFAIKDNIDLDGVPTTAACPAYTYIPDRSATVVQRLIDAGAIPVGKTNMDQFATGLVGTRSPYGVCRNAFDLESISGGSSSGSAVAVALGLVSFALGTDTAGSGRVPAALNNLVGLKPTRGLLSTRGVVPACRTLDCVSVFAMTADDAGAVFDVAGGFDAADPYSRSLPAGATPAFATPRLRIGVPAAEQLAFFGDVANEELFAAAVSRAAALGAEVVEIDFAPFRDAASLLYEGPWVAERHLVVRSLLETLPDEILPVTRAIIAAGATPSAADAFAAEYRLAELRRASEATWQSVDVVLTPTVGTTYRIAEVEAEPIRLNSTLGYYCNFMNLLDLSAIAVPAGFRPDGLPFGVTLFAPAFSDRALLELGARWQAEFGLPLGATGLALPPRSPVSPRVPAGMVDVVVCGAHLEGLPLNHQLTERGGRLVARTRTAPCYRFYALAGGPPFRPGLVRCAEGGTGIAVEVWRLPVARFGSFVAGIPAPLGIGKVELEDGRLVSGFLCEDHAVAGAEDITELGDWRKFLEQ